MSFFFVSSRRRHTRSTRDWSSDVCSSDLVGPTSAGKSTAIALLHRAFDPQSGIIKIDGMDIRGLKLTALRRNIGVVFQEALLFNRSIADNLMVGRPDAAPADMRKAAERA